MGRVLIIGGAVLVALYLLTRKRGQMGATLTASPSGPHAAVDITTLPPEPLPRAPIPPPPTLSAYVNGGLLPSTFPGTLAGVGSRVSGAGSAGAAVSPGRTTAAPGAFARRARGGL